MFQYNNKHKLLKYKLENFIVKLYNFLYIIKYNKINRLIILIKYKNYWIRKVYYGLDIKIFLLLVIILKITNKINQLLTILL